jgi:uncharacterized protein YlxP (DUF503 family)
MRVATLTVWLHAPWVHSLKEKRMETKSLIAKVRAKFNVSAAEAEEQDTLKTIVLSFAALAGNAALADSITDHILNFLEENSEAAVTRIRRELR